MVTVIAQRRDEETSNTVLERIKRHRTKILCLEIKN
jgi:hypothetical protein